MGKDSRSAVNPFTGKKHYDSVNDDKFLEECYNLYYNEINQYQLLDDTQLGQQVFNVTTRLVHTVEDYLQKINRYDYVADYYDWEVHLVNSDIANACCYPGGKIVVYAGILSYMESEDELAFVLAHEVSHALLDHSRTRQSVEQTKNSISSLSWMGTFALDLMGFGAAGDLARAAVNVADIGSHYFLTQPWGRNHELEADKLGLTIAYLAGYDVNGVPVFWQRFSQAGSNEFDFFSTHPSDDKRIAVMRESIMEIQNDGDFYSKPLLPETPEAKNEYKTDNMQNFSPNSNQGYNQPNPNVGYDTANVNTHVFNQPMTCPNCNSNVMEGDNFCGNCGFNLTQKYCQHCGNRARPGDLYCMACGTKLE